MPKNTPPEVQEIEQFWRNGQDARAIGESATQRERLLIELVFAARSLANHAIHLCPAGPKGVADGQFIHDCRECGRISTGPGPIVHKPACHAGRVADVISQIQALFPAKGAESQGGAQRPPRSSIFSQRLSWSAWPAALSWHRLSGRSATGWGSG